MEFDFSDLRVLQDVVVLEERYIEGSLLRLTQEQLAIELTNLLYDMYKTDVQHHMDLYRSLLIKQELPVFNPLKPVVRFSKRLFYDSEEPRPDPEYEREHEVKYSAFPNFIVKLNEINRSAGGYTQTDEKFGRLLAPFESNGTDVISENTDSFRYYEDKVVNNTSQSFRLLQGDTLEIVGYANRVDDKEFVVFDHEVYMRDLDSIKPGDKVFVHGKEQKAHKVLPDAIVVSDGTKHDKATTLMYPAKASFKYAKNDLKTKNIVFKNFEDLRLVLPNTYDELYDFGVPNIEWFMPASFAPRLRTTIRQPPLKLTKPPQAKSHPLEIKYSILDDCEAFLKDRKPDDLEKTRRALEKKLKALDVEDICKDAKKPGKMKIVKLYMTSAALEADQGKRVYVDKAFDTTPYHLAHLDDSGLQRELAASKLSPWDVAFEMKSIRKGKRRVKLGEQAIISSASGDILYTRRKINDQEMWVKEVQLPFRLCESEQLCVFDTFVDKCRSLENFLASVKAYGYKEQLNSIHVLKTSAKTHRIAADRKHYQYRDAVRSSQHTMKIGAVELELEEFEGEMMGPQFVAAYEERNFLPQQPALTMEGPAANILQLLIQFMSLDIPDEDRSALVQDLEHHVDIDNANASELYHELVCFGIAILCVYIANHYPNVRIQDFYPACVERFSYKIEKGDATKSLSLYMCCLVKNIATSDVYSLVHSKTIEELNEIVLQNIAKVSVQETDGHAANVIKLFLEFLDLKVSQRDRLYLINELNRHVSTDISQTFNASKAKYEREITGSSKYKTDAEFKRKADALLQKTLADLEEQLLSKVYYNLVCAGIALLCIYIMISYPNVLIQRVYPSCVSFLTYQGYPVNDREATHSLSLYMCCLIKNITMSKLYSQVTTKTIDELNKKVLSHVDKILQDDAALRLRIDANKAALARPKIAEVVESPEFYGFRPSFDFRAPINIYAKFLKQLNDKVRATKPLKFVVSRPTVQNACCMEPLTSDLTYYKNEKLPAPATPYAKSLNMKFPRVSVKSKLAIQPSSVEFESFELLPVLEDRAIPSDQDKLSKVLDGFGLEGNYDDDAFWDVTIDNGIRRNFDRLQSLYPSKIAIVQAKCLQNKHSILHALQSYLSVRLPRFLMRLVTKKLPSDVYAPINLEAIRENVEVLCQYVPAFADEWKTILLYVYMMGTLWLSLGNTQLIRDSIDMFVHETLELIDLDAAMIKDKNEELREQEKQRKMGVHSEEEDTSMIQGMLKGMIADTETYLTDAQRLKDLAETQYADENQENYAMRDVRGENEDADEIDE